MRTYDFIVVGSGIAGLSFALRAARHGEVAVLTKKNKEDSSTSWAQGGISCVTSEQDSFDLHLQDTLNAGAGLCKTEVARTIVTEAPESIGQLIRLGVEFDRRKDENGKDELDLTREGGHSKRRVLHSEDTTGREISRRLIDAVQAEPNIHLLENHNAIDLITTGKLGYASEDRVLGLYVLDETTGEVVAFHCPRVVLSTGGCGKVYQYTTNPNVSTGDGVAMAWRAGVAIANMEFIQFHPTCLYHRDLRSFLISEAVRGEGGRIIGADGKEFMHKYDKRKSLAPRDIVARAIDSEIKRTGQPCAFVDISHRSKDFVATRFPNIYQTCLRLGIDAGSEPIPVVPAAHYQCGGVLTDVNGATSIHGLYAIGEVACTGLHGANRLASNSLLEGAVVAARAAEHILTTEPIHRKREPIDLPAWESGNAHDNDELVVIYHNWDEIRHLMWDYVSIVRTDKRLQRAATRLRNLQREVQEFYWNYRITSDLLELRNLVQVAALIVDSAVSRRESRGLHYTLNYPERDDAKFCKDTLLRRY